MQRILSYLVPLLYIASTKVNLLSCAFTTKTTTTAIRPSSFHQIQRRPSTVKNNDSILNQIRLPKSSTSLFESKRISKDIKNSQYLNDYLITDSLSLTTRPTFLEAISNPRDLFVSLPLILIGFFISLSNILGTYNDTYLKLEALAISFGFLSVLAYMYQIITNYMISPNIRRGIIDDATVNLYAALYTGAVSWLALRTSEFCPVWVYSMGGDSFIPLISVGVFVFSLLAPFFTLFGDFFSSPSTIKEEKELFPWYQYMVSFTRSLSMNNNNDDGIISNQQEQYPPELSDTELLRCRGLLAIGVLGCIFAPDALSFFLGGQEWWGRVSELHPSQRILESSTSLFALFSVEASMISHRCGKQGVSTYRQIVPAFAVVCLVLAIIPCVCAVYFLGDDVSFFSFYTE